MRHDLWRDVLKGVSRSFYLSLRLLPAPMGRPAGIAYLLARTTDTIADSPAIPASDRLALLDGLAQQISGGAVTIPIPKAVIGATPNPKEKVLLEKHMDIIKALDNMPDGVQGHIRRVIGVIADGQKLDLIRFGNATARNPAKLPSADDLEDYAWRVAGCVGEFWTKLGFETLGSRFSAESPGELLPLGVDFGKGLQLVNILRDLPADLRMGRCYLPVENPADRDELMRESVKWMALAAMRMDSGLRYSSLLSSKRLRVAGSLPAQIGKETIRLMRDADWNRLEKGMRIPRSRVHIILLHSLAKA